VVGPGHQILELVLLLLRLDLAHLLLVYQIVAADAHQVQLLYLILQHKLQLLDVRLVQLVALQPLLLQQLDLQLQTAVYLSQLRRLYRVALLQLHRVGLQTLQLVATLGQLARQLVVVLGQQAVLLDQAVHLQLEVLSLAQLYLQERYFVEETAVLGFSAESALQVQLLLDELALDARGRTAGVVAGGVPVVAHADS
jgi:hypothetical protein